MYILGLLASTLGNIAIGTGQTCQKYALNKIGNKSLPALHRSGAPKIVRRHTSIHIGTLIERIREPIWILGVLLSYFGEAGNWIALSQVSAAMVTPLGSII